ncbi:S-layer homology domain-containing protein [Fodinisporobacter ferrooxydans]|uniref:S-layer homology domain-containing protein n=1 Tax=Fodinisporobacter ferrooxydans TaxID=2901836 RepID=A0ABY4CNW0_9BACL|nr:S-layer homology domain-containing protein [Alicyclobacillaceae bacterium MYW30-H2]
MKSKKILMTAAGISFLFAASDAFADTSWFQDVSTIDPNYPYIADLYNLHKISGNANGYFGPNDSLTRAEFVTMIEKAFNVQTQPNATIPFHDVNQGDWYFQNVVDAYANGITAGVSATQFAPNSYVTKEQAAQMIVHFLGNSLPPNPKAGLADVSDADPWAKTAVANILAYGFRSQTNTNLPYDPKRVMTRGQASALIDLAYHYISKTPAPQLAPIAKPLPSVDQSNLIPNSDGSFMFVNLASGYRPIKDPSILALFKQVKFSADENHVVTVRVPDSGTLWWTVLSYSANKTWQGAGAKTMTFNNPMDFEIQLLERASGSILVSVYVQNRDGQWYARY